MKRHTRHDPDGLSSRGAGAPRRAILVAALAIAGTCSLTTWAFSAGPHPRANARVQDGASTGGDPISTSPLQIEETRLTLNKWIETQQILAKERNEWAQGKEVLQGRIELVEREIGSLEEKIDATVAAVNESNKKRDGLLAQKEQLDATVARLAEAVGGMETELRKMFPSLPQPIQDKLEPLRQRIPEDPTKTKASVAERFQNVLGILNELNKANTEIAVTFEVRELAGGKPSEVQAIYVGLAQGYYHSPNGEAGIGRPTPQGWKWEPSKALGNDVFTALEILQGKHTPAFVPLPVKLQ